MHNYGIYGGKYFWTSIPIKYEEFYYYIVYSYLHAYQYKHTTQINIDCGNAFGLSRCV